VASDVKKLRPTELCRLLNSTPLGEVIDERKLKRHRDRAGLRIGDARHVDLLRYVAWLVQLRHGSPAKPTDASASAADLAEAAQAAAEFACDHQQLKGHGQKFTRKHEALIAALLTEPTHAKAAAKAGVSKATITRWLRMPEFRAAYDRARREMVDMAIGRMQTVSGPLVETVINVALHGRRDSDRTRAAFGLLDRAHRGLPKSDAPLDLTDDGDAPPLGTAGLVQRLEARLDQVERSELTVAEKAHLTAKLSDALLRARKDSEFVGRLEALEAVLQSRKEKKE